MNSRDKGKRGELAFAAYLRDHGWHKARRGVQHSGGPDSPDVAEGPPGYHFEVKRVEKLRLWDALAQAMADAGDDVETVDGLVPVVPVVAFKRNRYEWVAILRMDDFLEVIDR